MEDGGIAEAINRGREKALKDSSLTNNDTISIKEPKAETNINANTHENRNSIVNTAEESSASSISSFTTKSSLTSLEPSITSSPVGWLSHLSLAELAECEKKVTTELEKRAALKSTQTTPPSALSTPSSMFNTPNQQHDHQQRANKHVRFNL